MALVCPYRRAINPGSFDIHLKGGQDEFCAKLFQKGPMERLADFNNKNKTPNHEGNGQDVNPSS